MRTGGEEGEKKEIQKGRGTPKDEKDTSTSGAIGHRKRGEDDDEGEYEDEVEAAADGGELTLAHS